MKKRTRTSKGFTLLEMLVVIAIMSLLMVLIVPSVRSSRQRAVQVRCLGDIRQVGVAILQYTTEHRFRFPGYGTGAGDRYIHKVAPYLGADFSPHGAWRNPVFRCPLTPSSLITESDSAGVYAMNIWTMRNRAPPHAELQKQGPSIASFNAPSDTIMLGETIVSKSVERQLQLRHDAPYPKAPNGASNNHGGEEGACNYVYMDGRGVFETEWPGIAAF